MASRCGLAEVAAALEPGDALVSFLRYERARPSRRGAGARRPGAVDFWGWSYGPSLSPVPTYLAFVLRAGERTPHIVPLGGAPEIESRVAEWRDRAGTAVPARLSSARLEEAAYRTAALRLRRRVWDPVARYLAGARRIFIVPDGALDLVNFAALPAGKSSYLVERGPLLHYLSADRDIVLSSAPPDTCVGLLAVGAPDFDARPEATREAIATAGPGSSHAYRGQRAGCEAFRAARFAALPGSAAEVAEIATLWHEGGARCLLGPAATETAFKDLAPGHEVLHIATHGFIVGGGCPSTLPASRGIGGTAAPGEVPAGAPANGHAGEADRPGHAQPENPLLFNGLAFAGANHRDDAPPDGDDGILTAEEIGAMDLSGVRWAVLSACETGVGEVQAGEGVLGLRRAFQVAGARTTIMSLWRVDDQATRQWMGALYRARLVGGRNTAESVREAALEILRGRRARGESTHPFTWGAFVASGDWR